MSLYAADAGALHEKLIDYWRGSGERRIQKM
jgi:hypothetical protein